jgi:hypothetical protein
MSDTSFHVAVRPHPFKQARELYTMLEGITIEGIVNATIPPERRRLAVVFVQDTMIPDMAWPHVRPKPGTYVRVTLLPQKGGGGKNPVTAVLSVALAFAAPALGAAFATQMGIASASFLGVSGTALMTGVVSVVGKLALTAIAPPAVQKNRVGTPDPAEGPTQFITGAQNREMPGGKVPRPLGRVRMVPPLGARSYTENVGNDQYVRMLFVWGYGPLEISDLRIGDTALSEFKGVEMEHRYGYADDEPLTLYTNDIGQNPLSVVLREADGWQVRTTEDNVDEISIDLTFGRGLTRFNSTGKKVDQTVEIDLQYALTGTDDWVDVNGYKVAAVQESPVMKRPPANKGNVVEIVWRISVDKVSGKMKAEAGAAFIHGVDAGTPVAPPVPEGFWPVARVSRRSDDAATNFIDAAAITDDRDPDVIGTVFNNPGDFLVEPSLKVNRVDVGHGGLKQERHQISGRQTAAMLFSQRWTVPRGQYDVRLRRITPDTNDEKTLDEATWTALRSIRATPPVKAKGIAMTALRIKATDQLNGVVDRFNGIVHSILPDWDGTAWVERATSNPAAIYREVLQGKANARALGDSRLNLTALQAWAADCTAAGREFNLCIDYETSIHDLLQIVCAAGRASPSIVDGKWQVVQDKPQTVPVQLFTPRNVRGFQAQKIFPDLPHAFRVRFKNRNKDYLDDEIIVYDDGYNDANATRFEALALTGVTDPDQAWKDGRYHIATARLRSETYTFTTDVEHIVCTRGDLIAVAHDVIAVSLGSGRVKSLIGNGATITGAVLDESFIFLSGKSYTARIRFADGGQILMPLNTSGGETSTLMFITPFSMGDGPAVGDLVTVGENGKETIKCIIRAIEPSSDMSARITALPAAPAVHTADTGAIPPHDPQITLPIDLRRPPSPLVATIQSGSQLLIQSGEASFVNAIVIMLEAHGWPRQLTPVVSIRGTDETLYRPADALITDGKITITDIDLTGTYDIRLYYRAQTGLHSAETVIGGYDVQGGVQPPPDVENFTVNIQGETAYLSWSPVSDIFLSHYRIRYAADLSNVSWESAVDLIQRVGKPSTSVTAPALAGAYLIKAVSTSDRESENVTIIRSTVRELEGVNIVETMDEAPIFAGDKVDVEVGFGAGLILSGTGEITEGFYYFENILDLGEIHTSTLNGSVSATSIDIGNNFDLFPNIDLVANIDGTTGSTAWEARLQVSTTEDDPVSTPVWSEYTDLIIGKYTARALRFRLVMRSLQFGISPFVYDLKVVIDMPDRTVGRNNLTAAAGDVGGTLVTFPDGAFKALPALAVTAESLSAGDNHEITDIRPEGFRIKFFDTGGSRVTRTFDYLAKGWGRRIEPITE